VKRLGIYQPVMWSEEAMEHVLSLIPDVRVIVAVCDPADRFERKLHLENEPSEDELQEKMLKKVQDQKYLYFGAALASLRNTFGERMLLVEKDNLDRPQTYERLASFLDVRPFPAHARPRRYNSRGLRRTSLCSQPPLVEWV
ncbi:unnamed protein product, partial [Symbiodinium pilosum]